MAERYTAQQVIDAIETASGYVTKAASVLGCDARTVYNYAERYTSVQQAIDDQREQRTDFVESALMKAIKDGNVTAMIFYLKADPHAKARGWSERSQHEVSGKDGGPVETRTTHAIDSDAAVTIFDILTEVGAISAIAHDAEDDAIHTAQS